METVLQPWSFIPQSLVAATLATPVTAGKRLLEPLKALAADRGLPMKILEDCAIVNNAEVHRHEGDLWHCLQGSAEFVVGGTLVDPCVEQIPDGGIDDREWKAKMIADGVVQVLTPGDWLWIPPGQPHLHRTTGHARLLIIKVPTPEPIPVSAIPGWHAGISLAGSVTRPA